MTAQAIDKEYIIFCDESEKKGKYYSDFYGGLIVGSSQYERITRLLNEAKQELNFYGEVKWEKITQRYEKKYIDLIRRFFKEIAAGHVRMRIMFTQNAHVPIGLQKEHYENRYFLLYYQFIKFAFGLETLGIQHFGKPCRLRIYVDEIGDTREKIDQFKGFLHALPKNKRFARSRFILPMEDITEVRSHDHVLLQCLDIVLGAMSFRLNDRHKEKLPGQNVRGKRTRAKENVYKAILAEIREIKPGFNIGITTGGMTDPSTRWCIPYSHWCFKARDSEFHIEMTKGAEKKSPIRPTSVSDA